jgi:hypothetical protein
MGNALARNGSTVGAPVDHQRARPADPFPTVVVEDDRFLALGDQALVDHVEQLEERGLVTDLLDCVGLEAPVVVRPFLAPDAEREIGERRRHL